MNKAETYQATEIFKISQIMGFYCCDYVDSNGDTTITVRDAEAMDWPVSFSSLRERKTLEGNGYEGKRDDEYYADLVTDMVIHGFNVPVSINYVDGAFYLVNGHHRIAAAIELGIDRIPCMYVHDMVASEIDGSEWGDGRHTRDYRS